MAAGPEVPLDFSTVVAAIRPPPVVIIAFLLRRRVGPATVLRDFIISANLAFGRKGGSFTDYEQRVRLRKQSTRVDPPRQASISSPQMDAAARQVYLNAGGDTSMKREDVENFLRVLRNYFRPDALDRIYQQARRPNYGTLSPGIRRLASQGGRQGDNGWRGP